MFLGVAHPHIDGQRYGDHHRDIDVESLFNAGLLEPQSHELCRSAEQCIGQRIRQRHAQRTDMRGKQLRLHHGIDRRVTCHDDQSGHHQQPGNDRVFSHGQSREDRIGAKHTHHAEADHQRLAPDPVGQRTRDRLEQHEQKQRRRIDLRRDLTAQPAGVHQEFLHVDAVGIESDCAAGRQQHHRQRLARMVGDQLDKARFRRTLRLGYCKALCLRQPAPQPEDDDRQQPADEEGYPPSPGVQLRLAQRRLQQQQDADRHQLPGDQSHILKAGEETAPVLARHFGQIGRARAIFATDRQPLHQPRQHQQQRRRNPDRFIARRHRDQQRPRAHQRHRQRQPALAPMAISIDAHQPRPDRPHQETDGEDARRAQQLRGAILAREEMRREIEGEGGIGVPVIPFHQIAGGPADNGLQPLRLGRRPLLRRRAHGLSTMAPSWTPQLFSRESMFMPMTLTSPKAGETTTGRSLAEMGPMPGWRCWIASPPPFHWRES
eukprot:Opistho-2@65721